MLKFCVRCKTLVPASQYEAHRQRHHNRSKPRNAKEPEYLRNRPKALKRDRHTCQRCGRDKEQLRRLGRRLEVHHLDGDPYNNALTNLQTVCSDPDCHPRGGHQPKGSIK